MGFINDREAQMWAQKLEMQGYSYIVLKNTGSTMIHKKDDDTPSIKQCRYKRNHNLFKVNK